MEQAQKNLKYSSLFVLLFAVLSLINIIAALAFGPLNQAEIPAGAPENTLAITKIFLLVVSLLMLVPDVYVGVKGLRVAKTPNTSKGHIVWACILFVFSALALIDPVVACLKDGAWGENVGALFNIGLDLIIYYEFIVQAKAVAKLAA